MQNKWLEIIRSRRVTGAETAVKWVWAAMNPKSYSATNALDEAVCDITRGASRRSSTPSTI